MTLQPQSEYPHGFSNKDIDLLSTKYNPIIFAFHGHPWRIHWPIYRRPTVTINTAMVIRKKERRRLPVI